MDFDEDAEFFNFNIEENVINNTMTIDGLDLVFTGTLIFGLPNGNGTGLALKKGGGLLFSMKDLGKMVVWMGMENSLIP